MESLNAKRSTTKIHFFYVVLILSLALIGIATYHWTNLKGFPEYLSVAATLTSLVLGILAIIYSFVSSGAMNQFLGSIQSSTASMNNVAVELRNVMIKGQDVQARAEERTLELHQLAESLSSSLASLEESTRNISGKVDSIPTQLSALHESIASSSLSAPHENGADVDKSVWTDSRIKKVLTRVSQFGMVNLQGISTAKNQNKYLDVEKLDDANLYHYGYGYLMALQATGLIKLDFATKEDTFHAVRLASGHEKIQEIIAAEWDLRKVNAKKMEYILSKESSINHALHDGSPRK